METLTEADLPATLDVLVPALSDGRRIRSKLVTGTNAAFGSDLEVVFVPAHPPVLPGRPVLASMTAGLVLQAAPTKEVAARLPADGMPDRVRAALGIVEGAAALGWALERWPGLAGDLTVLAGGVAAADYILDPAEMFEQALALADRHDRPVPVPAIFGRLPRCRTDSAGAAGGRRLRPRRRVRWSPDAVRRMALDSNPAAGPDGEPDDPGAPAEDTPDDLVAPNRSTETRYPEWDSQSGAYRPDHVTVAEVRLAPGAGQAAAAVPGLAEWFQRSPTLAWARRLEDGTDLDLSAYVDHHARGVAGEATDGRVYMTLAPGQRDVATAILLDASSSLQNGGGRSFALELACADALTAAMARTGERCSVFAFTGMSRERVEVRVLQDFDDPAGLTSVRDGRVAPGGYTRLGAALRHVTRRLLAVPAERRILLSIGDGVPYDIGYRGIYAKGDVAKAVEEASDAGVVVYQLGVGDVRHDPLPECFGEFRSSRVASLDQLPEALACIHEVLVRQ